MRGWHNIIQRNWAERPYAVFLCFGRPPACRNRRGKQGGPFVHMVTTYFWRRGRRLTALVHMVTTYFWRRGRRLTAQSGNCLSWRRGRGRPTRGEQRPASSLLRAPRQTPSRRVPRRHLPCSVLRPARRARFFTVTQFLLFVNRPHWAMPDWVCWYVFPLD